MLNPKQVLIIGGSGFLGAALAKRLASEYYVVTTSCYSNVSFNPNTHNYKIDYNIEEFRELIGSHDFKSIIYLSGNPSPSNSERSPTYDLTQTNIPLLNLLQAATQRNYNGTIWFASSVAVYGSCSDPMLSEDSKCEPLSFYAASKLMGENHMKVFNRVYGLKAGSLRIFSTYGPGLKRQLIYDIFNKITSGSDEIKLFGTGCEARDISFVSDQVDAIKLIFETFVPNGDCINIGSGELYTTSEIANVMMGIMKSNSKLVFEDSLRTYDGYAWRADISRLKKLGFKQQFDLHKGLIETVHGYEEKI